MTANLPFRGIVLRIALMLTMLVLGAAALAPTAYVHADMVTPRALTISNSAAGAANVTYMFETGILSASAIGSIRFQFCSNTSLVGGVCTTPAGLDTSGAVLSSISGPATGFTVHAGTDAHDIVISRNPSVVTTGTTAFTFDGIINPDYMGTTFVRVMTYASDDASGPVLDSGGLAFATNEALTVTAEVPPFLLFCAGATITGLDCTTTDGDFVDLGQLTSDTTAGGTNNLVAASNAASGYSISVSAGTLASCTNVILPMTGQPSQAGTSQFGLNLRQNLDPVVGSDPSGPGNGQPTAAYNIANQFRFASGEAIVATTAPDDYRKYTTSYVVNVPKDQPGGFYATTITYVCLANF